MKNSIDKLKTDKKDMIMFLVIGCMVLVFCSVIFWAVTLDARNNTHLAKVDKTSTKTRCIQLLEDTRNKCDYTIKVGAWSWDCNDDEVYQKMILRNRSGLFCVEKAYSEPFETTLTYTCELKDGRLMEQRKLKINGKNCANFERSHFFG